jgi:hypothetical protein
MQQLDGAAGFHDLENRRQTVATRLFAEGLLDKFLLVRLTVEFVQGDAGLGGLFLNLINERLGMFLDEGQEVLAAYPQGAVNPAVVAAENRYNLGTTGAIFTSRRSEAERRLMPSAAPTDGLPSVRGFAAL